MEHTSPPVFDLLTTLAADGEMRSTFSEQATVTSWLRCESALANAQAAMGVISHADRDAINAVADVRHIDLHRLWNDTRTVGYPILPLVRQLDELLRVERRGSLHLGATTQDIMDTGLALQLAAASSRLRTLLVQLGDGVASQASSHVHTVMPGRTHAMHAVPTTWGAKMAVYLSELRRLVERLDDVFEQVSTVSLYGAGGTSAAWGEHGAEIRLRVAAELGLAVSEIPWHVARDRVAEWGQVCVAVCAVLGRFAREVIDLSRTEIGEVRERAGHHRGASSTMPQKRNPISSEVLVGYTIVVGSMSSGLARIMESQHERAAGEWQAEWVLIPQLANSSAAALVTAIDLVDGLVLDKSAMQRNLQLDDGLIMAEAFMMDLAQELGRERAHDLVYAAAATARRENRSLAEVVAESARSISIVSGTELRPAGYVGHPASAVDEACASWEQVRSAHG